MPDYIYLKYNLLYLDIDTISNLSWWLILLGLIVYSAVRYFSLAGIAYYIFYRLPVKWLRKFKIQTRQPSAKQIQRELYYSLFTVIVFAFNGMGVYYLFLHGYTRLYLNINDYSYGYLGISFIALLFIHDTYFYWTHRLLHTKWLYKKVHVVHHLSVNPSPWTSYSFHPVEAFVESLIIFPLVTLFPVYLWAFLFFTFVVIVTNIIGHLGFEIFPNKIRNSKLGRFLASSTYHNLHHQRNKINFGYYFSFWDKVMGTCKDLTNSKYVKHEKSEPI